MVLVGMVCVGLNWAGFSPRKLNLPTNNVGFWAVDQNFRSVDGGVHVVLLLV